jgi:two-component system phosphate regulon sensor histidine kinase PhoR
VQTTTWRSELGLLALWLGGGLLFGLLLGRLGWGVALGAVAFSLRSISNVRSLHRWLNHHADSEPPEAKGLWGDLFDGLYRLQKRDREERGRLRALVSYMRESFSSLPYGAVMIDPQGNIEWSNRAAEGLLGLRYPEDTGQQLLNLLRAPEFVAWFEAEDYSQPLELPAPARPNSWLQVHITFFGRRSRLLFVRDVTQAHRLEQMRTDFVANVSHELRTPLTVINGYLETLSDNAGQLPPRWQRAVQQMLQQSQRMRSLIRDLLLLSRLETVPQGAEQEPLDPSDLLEEIREEALAAIPDDRHIEISCDECVALVGRAEELRSAFANLIFNAVRYTKPGGHIDVRWYADAEHAYLQVEDDGVGIDPEHIPRLTERFYRVDASRSMDTGGTGLGLAIVKHVLLRHQATLQITSAPGQGSCFTCVFPGARVVRTAESVRSPVGR